MILLVATFVLAPPEIAVLSRSAEETRVLTIARDGRLFLWDRWGRVVPGWPVTTPDVPEGPVGFEDVDGNGASAVIATFRDPASGARRLGAFGLDGIAKPQAIALSDRPTGTPRLVDLDGDGFREWIYGTCGGEVRIASIGGDDRSIPGIPIRPAGEGSGVFVSVTSLDADPLPEVVVAAGVGNAGRVWVFHPASPSPVESLEVEEPLLTAPSFADTDRDGLPDAMAVASERAIALWRRTESSSWIPAPEGLRAAPSAILSGPFLLPAGIDGIPGWENELVLAAGIAGESLVAWSPTGALRRDLVPPEGLPGISHSVVMEAAEGEAAAFVGSRSGLDLTWVRHQAIGSGRLSYRWRDLEFRPATPEGVVLGVDPIHLPIVRLNGRLANVEVRSGDPISSPLEVEAILPREGLYPDTALHLSLGHAGFEPALVPWDEVPDGSGERRFVVSLGIPEGRHRVTVSIGATPYVDLELVVTNALRISEMICYPNPFREAAELQFNLSRSAEIAVRIFSISGRAVARLGPFPCTTGFNTIDWNGRDDGGYDVADGAYYVSLIASAEGGRDEKRSILLRSR